MDLNGLANALDRMREELPPAEGVDHRAGLLYMAADCLRQANELERNEGDIAALRGMVTRRNERIAKLERQVARTKELYESSLAVVRRLQEECEGLIDRVEKALLGIEGSRLGRRWVTLRRTSNSGKTLFVCTVCGRVSPTPDKECRTFEDPEESWGCSMEEPGAMSIFSEEAMQEAQKKAAWHRAMHGEDD